MVTDLKTAVECIKANPGLKELRLPKRVINKIRKELEDMQMVRPSPRPTYGPPWGDVDRMLWDGMMAEKKLAPIKIMGVPVVTK